MTPTLEETLVASIALTNARKAGRRPEALPPGPVSEDSDTRRAGLHLMPKPQPAAPSGSEVPAILSPSSVNCFMDCSAKWYYRKVLKLEETRSGALGLGTAVHTALIENYRQKIETKEDLDTTGVRALFIHALCDELDAGLKLQANESADDLKQAGEMMVRVYMEQAAPRVEPAAVEEHVEGLIGGVPVHGYIDVRDVDGRIIDIKTAKKRPSGMMPAYRLQVSTYVMLHPEASGRAQLSTLTKTKTVSLHEDTIDVLPPDRKLTEHLYSIARDQMQTGLVAPNRNSFLCGKYCGFAGRCVSDYGGVVAGEGGE